MPQALGELDLIYDPKNGVGVSDQYGGRLAAIKGKRRSFRAAARRDTAPGSVLALPLARS